MIRVFEMADDMLELIVQHFGTTDEPYNGPTYILPNGFFLNLQGHTHHSDVEKWLIDNNLSENQYMETAGSPTLYDLGCIRCDTVKYYVDLCNVQPTCEQYNTLLIWLDFLSKSMDKVEVVTPDFQYVMYSMYDDRGYNVDYIVDRIRRYYTCGKLYEQKEILQKHQFNFIYERKQIGSSI